ncbi:uncharacterized protein LOC135689499 [Rhopilema esculentum]|uniref:uncharacterized protein LOC135689499 n=1 Tax=Rhopilema esculentum TaxID=499914 RepID=UPI0031DF23C4
MKVFAVLLLLGILVGAFADPVKLDDNSAGTLDLLDEKVDVPDEDETVDEEPARAEDTETKDGTEEEDPKEAESDNVEETELADKQEDSRRNRLRLCSVECSHSCTYYKWFFWNKGCSCYRCPAGYYRKCGKKVRRCDGRFCYYRSPCFCELVPRQGFCDRFPFYACRVLKDCVNGKCSTLRKCYCDCRKGTVRWCFSSSRWCLCRRPRRRWG